LAAAVTSGPRARLGYPRDVDSGAAGGPERAPRTRRRDRHGRGLRGVLAPPDVPLHRSRAQRFDELVLQAVARLEPRWEAHLADVEFAVEEIPPLAELGPGPVPLARLEAGPAAALPAGDSDAAGTGPRPSRIVVYRRPLMARADGEEDLGELVFEVVVEEFARLLGLDPEDVDPGYPAEG
jgi:predicted Zn-dependent protease with MMP-like domain